MSVASQNFFCTISKLGLFFNFNEKLEENYKLKYINLIYETYPIK